MLARRIDSAIDKAIADQQVVGAVVMIARDGKLVYARAVGYADREAKRPMREDTMFRFASMTKPITAVVALALVDAGKLTLDEPITRWLPNFRPKLADGREPPITVRELLTHTSGLTYKFLEPLGGPYHQAEVSDGLAEPGLSADENLRRLASVPLVYEPGTTWQYSLSFDVLAEVAARAAGEPLPALVERIITRPLGMTDTAFVATDHERLAWPYAAGAPPVRMTEPYDMEGSPSSVRMSPARVFERASFPSGGAGLVGTASDYLRFAEALRAGGAPMLLPATARAMTTNQLGDRPGVLRDPSMGFGFAVDVVVDPALAKTPRGAGAYGWEGIYGTAFWVDPAARMSVVILTNLADDSALAGAVQKAIYNPAP